MRTKKDKRKRFRCKCCKSRINVVYTVDKKSGIIRFMCPKCNSHGEFKIRKRI
jgi:transcription elongation factor Elf1